MKKLTVLVAVLGALWQAPSAQACQQFYGVTQPKHVTATGNQEILPIVIQGVLVSVYLAETTTPATLYSDPGCTSVLSNPTSTLVDGSYTFYASDGVYDIAFSKTGYAFVNLSNVSIFEPLGEHIITSDRYSTIDVCASGTGAIDRVGSNQRTLLLNKQMTCSVDKTWPATLTLVCLGQGSINVQTGKTLTMNGTVLTPPGRSCFAGSGSVTFGASAGPYPHGGVGNFQPSYGTTVEINLQNGSFFTIVPTNGTAYTLSAPTKGGVGAEACIQIKNTFGVLGAPTFAVGYKLGAAWTNPANGFSRTICFRNLSGTYVEISRTAADVAN